MIHTINVTPQHLLDVIGGKSHMIVIGGDIPVKEHDQIVLKEVDAVKGITGNHVIVMVSDAVKYNGHSRTYALSICISGGKNEGKLINC